MCASWLCGPKRFRTVCRKPPWRADVNRISTTRRAHGGQIGGRGVRRAALIPHPINAIPPARRPLPRQVNGDRRSPIQATTEVVDETRRATNNPRPTQARSGVVTGFSDVGLAMALTTLERRRVARPRTFAPPRASVATQTWSRRSVPPMTFQPFASNRRRVRLSASIAASRSK